ncbi:MAG: response regulator [Lachnospiraceae bacterium]|nr:response regulator [Lachnospiraceae bacterium]
MKAGAAGAALVFALFLIFALNAGSVSNAADYASEYGGIVYNLENKLGVSEVNAVTQIDAGYIWVATYTGLYQYNGNTFTKLELDERIRNVKALLPNGRDGVWIGTNDSGLAYYSFRTGEIKFYTTEDGLGSNSVRVLCYGRSGELYVGTNSYLSVISENGVLSTYTGSEDMYYIRGISCRADGTIAVVSNGGTVFVIKDGIVSQTFNREDSGENYTAVKYASSGDLIIGSSDGKLYTGKLSGSKVTISAYKDTNSVGSIAYMYENSEGNLIIAGENGIGYFDDRGRFYTISRLDFNNSICDLYEDYQGNLWAASSRLGLLKLSKNPFTNVFSVAGIEDRIVNCILMSKGKLYVGCDDGLVILNGISYRPTADAKLDFLSGVRIRHILEDSKGNLWISTYGEGLFCYDGNEVTSFAEEDGLCGDRIRLTLEMSDGQLAVASSTGISFIKDGKITGSLGAEDGLNVEQILCLYETGDGKLFAGSDGDGVYIIENGKITGNIGLEQGLDGLVVMRIVETGEHFYLVTGSDLFVYEDGVCRALKNFPHSNNYDIIVSSDNKAWVTSSAGVYILKERELAADTNYVADLLNSARGLNASLVANSWNYVDGGDNLYLCCSTGVKSIQMQSYSEINNDFDVDIREVKLDDTVIEPDEEGVYHITSDTKRVTFTPAILNYSLSNPFVRMYLEGFEEDGVILGQSELRELSYTNLAFGNYIFHIQVLDNKQNVVKEKTVELHRDAKIYERSLFWIGVAAAAIIMIMAITWALTERRNARIIKNQYGQIEKAKEDAERTSEYKTLFLANMSHEIRTPINTIMGMDELILREDISNQVRQYANDIYISSESLLNIVNDILDLSKIESGKMNIVPVEYSMSEMLRELGTTLRMKAEEAKLQVILDFDPDLPEGLYGDNNRFKQVITNLLTNAVKYTQKGSVTFKAALLDKHDCMADIEISVIDTGIGIRKEDMSRLFKEFERLDEERNHRVSGTGLGLPITKQLLELMGSKLEVDSIYEEGSNFHFVISQKIISDERIGELDMEAAQDSGFAVYKPSFIAPDVSILVVDDTPLNLAVIRGLLRSTKVQIDTGESGLVALEKVKQKKYDLILLDHMMPEMDGIETLEQLGNINHKCMGVPIIVLTANAIAGARENYIKLGFTDYLSKPVSGKDLETMLLKYLPAGKLLPPEGETAKPAPAEKTQNSGYSGLHLVDPGRGISFCAGDEELYKSVLGMFVDEYDEETRALQDYINLKDSKKFVTHAHKLKSSARTIGADELFEKAKDLETDGKEENWESIQRKFSSVMQLYLDVVMEVKTRML